MSSSAGAGWIGVPGWNDLPWLRAGFSTRQGGVSSVYGCDELNLGWTAEDAPENVAANRRLFLEAVGRGEPSMPLVTLKQVHGAVVIDLDGPGQDGVPLSADPGSVMTAEGRARLEGDGLVTRTPGIWLGAITADCTPVLLVDTRLRSVGSFHAGWRGTVAGVVHQGIETMTRAHGSRVEDLRAAIGPCIRSCCFEVGDEVVEQFRRAFGGDTEGLVSRGSSGRMHLDLQAANRLWLRRAGLPEEAIVTVSACTACSRTMEGTRRFFSHRAEKGVTGRMLSVIAVAVG